jgi:hypothetical protein
VKRQVYRYLLAIVGVIMLIGLIASCGDSSKPRVMVIDSMAYSTATQASVDDTLYKKYLAGMSEVKNGTEEAIEEQYWLDISPLITAEMNKKNPLYGLIIIIKADNYRIRYRIIWTTKPNYRRVAWTLYK